MNANISFFFTTINKHLIDIRLLYSQFFLSISDFSEIYTNLESEIDISLKAYRLIYHKRLISVYIVIEVDIK